MSSSPTRVVDYVVKWLAASGIDHVFGVGGANIEDLYDAAHSCHGITAVLAKHEYSAATMADGYSRAGPKLGVVVATSGGASLNLVPGLGESLASRVPVLALVGQPPSLQDGRGSFQDTSGLNGALDAQAIFSAVSLYCRRVLDPADIVTALPAAVAAALSGGPAVLLLPKDVQQAVLGLDPAPTRTEHAVLAKNQADPREILRTIRLTGEAVTIIAGEQIARDDARAEFEMLRSALGARVATVPDAKELHGSLGVTGVMGHPGVAEAIVDGGVCLLVGTRLPTTASAGLEQALAATRTVSIGSATPYVPCAHFHVDDLRTTIALLTRELTGPGTATPWTRPPAELLPPPFQGAGIRYRDAMSMLDVALPDDVDIVVDAGNTGAAAIHHLPARPAGRFVVALGMGGMGYSFGAGIGMAFARPHRRTVVIAGDGSFYMHGMELHTAVQYQLPITFVLFNNNAHAMCVTREQVFYGDRYSYNRFAPSRLGAGLSAMFPGLRSVDVEQLAELPGVFEEAFNVEGPSVVCVECSADEIPPFTPFLTARATQTDSAATALGHPTAGVTAQPLSKEEDGFNVFARA